MKNKYTSEFCNFAGLLADKVRSVSRSYFRTTIKRETKPDHTLVSQADREAEAIMRKLINQKYPSHGIIGEEYGSENSTPC